MVTNLESNWNWRRSKDLFLWDLTWRYLHEINGTEPENSQINTLLDTISKDKNFLISSLNGDNNEKSIQNLDRKIIRVWELIDSAEKIPEEVLQLSRDLYSPEETPIDLDSCIYSNWAFRARATKDFRHHKKANPDYWTAINMLYATNQAAYLMGGMEYNKIGKLKEYIDKAESLELFIWENRSRFIKYAPKNDNYYIEWSMLNTKNLSKSDEKGVFATVVFKLINDKGEIFNYSQVNFYDRQWIEYKTVSQFLNW